MCTIKCLVGTKYKFPYTNSDTDEYSIIYNMVDEERSKLIGQPEHCINWIFVTV